MNPLFFLLFELIYRPIYNLLLLLLTLFQGNMGLAVILLTLIVRFALRKTSLAGNQMQDQMNDLSPKMQEVQEKFKDDPTRLQEETMKVLKKHGAGPLKGCLMMLVQIPVFLGLYAVINKFANPNLHFLLLPSLDPLKDLYSFLAPLTAYYTDKAHIMTHLFGMDLLVNHNLVLAIIVGVLMYAQMRTTNFVRKPTVPNIPGATVPDMGKMMGFMNTFMAIMLATFVYSTKTGVGLYIFTTTIFSISQFAIQYRGVLKAKFLPSHKKSLD